jgi:hypothetical protein
VVLDGFKQLPLSGLHDFHHDGIRQDIAKLVLQSLRDGRLLFFGRQRLMLSLPNGVSVDKHMGHSPGFDQVNVFVTEGRLGIQQQKILLGTHGSRQLHAWFQVAEFVSYHLSPEIKITCFERFPGIDTQFGLTYGPLLQGIPELVE